MSTPPPDHDNAPYDPFRYGRPDPGSPAAAAFPEVFGRPPVPTGNPAAPAYGEAAAPVNPDRIEQPGRVGAPGRFGESARFDDPARFGPTPYPGSAPYGSARPNGYPGPASGPGPAPGNGRAVTGLVFGCLAFVLSMLTVFDLPLIILGVVFSVLGLRAARAGKGQRRLAVAGLVLSIVASFAVVAFSVVLVIRTEHCQKLHDRGTTSFNECLIHFSQ